MKTAESRHAEKNYQELSELPLNGYNMFYLENLYESYLQSSIKDERLKLYFERIQQINLNETENSAENSNHLEKQNSVSKLIDAHRKFGYIGSDFNPLDSPTFDQRLDKEYYGLKEDDLNKNFYTEDLLSVKFENLEEIIKKLKAIYCGKIGIEYDHISIEEERQWIRQYIEKKIDSETVTEKRKVDILRQLIASENLEKCIGQNFPGEKRFSIEGADSLLPMMYEIIERSSVSKIDIHNLIIGMAHRGRLNLLTNFIGKPVRELFSEFDDTKKWPSTRTGDVKYHAGYSSRIQTHSKKHVKMQVSILFNPSHLEFINPVVLGAVRSKQDRSGSENKKNYAVPVLIHGDASFSGQGVVAETLNMSQTDAYTAGGTIHIILNNQVGFTASDSKSLRSSRYCSDLAKMIEAPIIHVNGDDTEAAIKSMRLAFDYRMKFNKDVFIDLVCYRRHGHQEVDEPRITQPRMYSIIDNHPTIKEIYSDRLIQEGVINKEDIKKWEESYFEKVNQQSRVCRDLCQEIFSRRYIKFFHPTDGQENYLPEKFEIKRDTRITPDMAKKFIDLLSQAPKNFKLHRTVESLLKRRRKIIEEGKSLDWGTAEMLAYAVCVDRQVHLRIVGEDSRRGTFAHRHAVLHDQNTGEIYELLNSKIINPCSLTKAEIYDSVLSETAAVGFEYGYSIEGRQRGSTSDFSGDAPLQALNIWEAQFGDFANVAQVMIDQFISCGWKKWGISSKLVMFLPHGNEGMGPEHSSARLERYLQLCAQRNMTVFVPTTSSQIYHLLMYQAHVKSKIPLIVMTPKSLLRNELAASPLSSVWEGKLQLIIPEIDDIQKRDASRLIMCSGKVYYDLLLARRERKINNIAIIRVERLYPFPEYEVDNLIKSYDNIKDLVWCQEEPKNQGAWSYVYHKIRELLPKSMSIIYIGREEMAATADGYKRLFKKQQDSLIEQALNAK